MPKTEPQTFGEAMRRERTRRGLSVRKAADMLEVSPSWLSKAERGLEAPGPVTLTRISRRWGLDYLELLRLACRCPHCGGKRKDVTREDRPDTDR